MKVKRESESEREREHHHTTPPPQALTLSLGQRPEGVKMLIMNSNKQGEFPEYGDGVFTKNVVYREVL